MEESEKVLLGLFFNYIKNFHSCQLVTEESVSNDSDGLEIIKNLWEAFSQKKKKNKFNALREILVESTLQAIEHRDVVSVMAAVLRLVWLLGRSSKTPKTPAEASRAQPLSFLFLEGLKAVLPAASPSARPAFPPPHQTHLKDGAESDCKGLSENVVHNFLMKALHRTEGLSLKISSKFVTTLGCLCTDSAQDELRCCCLQIVKDRLSCEADEKESVAPMVDLVLFFGLCPDDGVDLKGLVQELCAADQWQVAERLVEGCRTQPLSVLEGIWQQLAETVINAAIGQERYKQASGYARKFQLQSRFPTLASLYMRQSVNRLAKKHQWQLAMVLVGEAKDMQEFLVQRLFEESQLEAALKLSEKFGLKFHLEYDVETLASLEEKRQQEYLQLPLLRDKIVIVDNASKVEFATKILLDEGPQGGIGLDVEWQAEFYAKARKRQRTVPPPTQVASSANLQQPDVISALDQVELLEKNMSEKEDGVSGVASLLQLSTKNWAFLMDLFALNEQPDLMRAADALLTKVFNDAAVLKLGFGFPWDLKVLRKSWPSLNAFRGITSLLELGKLTTSILQKPGAGKSLSITTKHWLGKHLDKSERLSDWAQRPLTEAQIQYAALDSHCLVLIFEAMCALKSDSTDMTKLASASEQSTTSLDQVPSWYQPFIENVHWQMSKKKMKKKDCRNESSIRDLKDKANDSSQGMLEPLTVANVKNFVAQFRSECQNFEFVNTPHITGTVSDAKQNPHDYFCKCLAFLIEDEPVVIILGGDCLVDMKKVAKWYRVGRRRARLATDAECIDRFGYPKGALPPCAHRTKAPVLVDQPVSNRDRLIVGAGELNSFLVISFTDLVFVTSAQIGNFSKGQMEKENGQKSLPLSRAGSEESVRPLIGIPPGGVLAGLEEGKLRSSTDICFILDNMLGRVARWFRVLGMDVLQWDKPSKKGDYSEIIEAARSSGRIILTRDSKLASRKECNACYLVLANDTQSQFEEVVRHFGLTFKEGDFMSRCAQCNTKGFAMVPKEEVRKRNEVKPKVLEKVEEFWECIGCNKLYWEGPKFDTACDKFSGLLVKESNVQKAGSTKEDVH